MKGILKTLAAFAIIAAMAIFTLVGMASASDQQWRKAIHGEYAITGTGACLFAFAGFNENFTPKGPPEAVSGPGPNFWDGVVTLEKNGHGKIDARQRYMDINDPQFPQGAAGLVQISWEFTYTVDRGKITFTEIPETYSLKYVQGPLAPLEFTGFAFSDTYDGYISADGKNLIVSFGVPTKIDPSVGNPPLPGEMICSGTFQGFRTDWEE
jgi:hypothetical protein